MILGRSEVMPSLQRHGCCVLNRFVMMFVNPCPHPLQIYALATFFERGRLITNGENIKFDNRGPLVLTSMLVVVVGLGALLQSGIMQA